MRFSRDVAGLDPARLTVIPNGIDPAPFDATPPVPRAAIGIPNDAHLALCVGRLDVQKGLPDLLDAAERVIVQRPDWHLALAGDGPNRDWLLVTTRRAAQVARQTSTGWASATTSRACSSRLTCWSMPRSGKGCPTLYSRQWLPVAP